MKTHGKAPKIPAYTLHRGTGQARVVIHGKHFYLGPHGTAESLERYHRLLAEHSAGVADLPQPSEAEPLTIITLCAAYFDHAQAYYQKQGEPTGEVYVIKSMIRAVCELHAHTRVDDFGPRALASMRAHLITRDNSRGYINKLTAHVRRMFKWAVSQELIPESIYRALCTVDGLKQGRTKARESKPVMPVADELVDATLPHLPPIVGDMVKLQRLTACRPGEICQLRPCDVDRSGEIWFYRPPVHKVQHHGRERIICIGPRAQLILRGYLDNRPVDAFCFSPRESQAIRFRLLRERRQTKVQPSQLDRRKRRPQRQPSDCYTTTSYARAIARGCELAFPVDEKWPADRKRRWRLDHHWTPNQLRHTAGTRIRSEFGLEASQVALGHAKADTTQIYAERDLTLAAEVARRSG